jgi:hypothetical protein
MQVIYHSRVCPPELKKEIRRDAVRKNLMPKERDHLDVPRYFPPLSTIDAEEFLANIRSAPYGRLLANGIGQESRKQLRIV